MTYIEAVFQANNGKLVSPDTWGPGEMLLMRDGLLYKRGIDGRDVQYVPTAEDEAAQWGFGDANLRRMDGPTTAWAIVRFVEFYDQHMADKIRERFVASPPSYGPGFKRPVE